MIHGHVFFFRDTDREGFRSEKMQRAGKKSGFAGQCFGYCLSDQSSHSIETNASVVRNH